MRVLTTILQICSPTFFPVLCQAFSCWADSSVKNNCMFKIYTLKFCVMQDEYKCVAECDQAIPKYRPGLLQFSGVLAKERFGAKVTVC